ncbi:ABC transporter substrate-binding protein [Colwellia sp. 4_MG-2023]|jgi:branched-chain amino acid transport system substrate-binding protein|uniref:ABC transporter substrate-binding protein n=1 Tax=unclassified Colwellia TaxID=196834 RepID=UPI001C098EA3|nr:MULTISPECIES: ABC transporter substrate-binding protein [unclassified Colwellia]MBU2926562.1 ABC transporter substrate-binding protein [Colwellia sp. C2M11]MDO6487521.1 ABC transporter substrate-binding protein [Colwellia sp. 6_MG-2023]MDO6507569.1 ABC transporter substrate-binding protein [Colwellia sp. 5_MG-2023]MDO6556404.1 ABC transporter substrate-binding protein [Colwellia sp. 4_MG-2023]MDO6652600.1 ABC transporter substrate-binding protein [Colwellia sp. 3_MG-2023]
MRKTINKKLLLSSIATTVLLSAISQAQAQDSVFVGHLADMSGPTAFVGKNYADGVRDSLAYINANGGISGTRLESETIDYAYKVPQAIANYKKWKTRKNMVAMQGWGTADTEALISFVARDKTPVFSASYSGHLTDPTAKNPHTKKPAPYNFFYGASYSDACRGLVQWAADDWKKQGKDGKPKFTHIGANHPFPNAPKAACAEYAEELGFNVLPPVVISMKPGDFKAQCLSIKSSGSNYGYIGNLGGSVQSLVKSCSTVGVDIQFMSNIWGGDKEVFAAAGEGIQDYIFPTMTPFWGDDVPGMKLLREISKMSDESGKEERVHHYIRGVCSTYFMKEAMEWAKDNGGITGENIKKGMYVHKDWVPKGLEGVCLAANWTSEDHRGVNQVNIYKGNYNDGDIKIEKVSQVTLDRRDDWLGY